MARKYKLSKLGDKIPKVTDGNKDSTWLDQEINMWRGLTRLTDIQFGFNMALKIVGN